MDESHATGFSFDEMEELVNDLWERKDSLDIDTMGVDRKIVFAVIEGLDNGLIRVAEPDPAATASHGWRVNEWVKKAVLLFFRMNSNELVFTGGVQGFTNYYDKVPLKFAHWNGKMFASAGIRVVPPAFARKGVFFGRGVVLMPSYCNIGAYVDEGTMVDTWATVGSCAQIGKNVHISGGAGIGGVLEPLQANPVIIEDGVFIGARSEVVEGVIVGEGAVLSMGVYLGASTKIVDRATGEVHRGYVPPYSVVVPGSMETGNHGLSLYCAAIVKTVDAQTRSKTAINELLRSS